MAVVTRESTDTLTRGGGWRVVGTYVCMHLDNESLDLPGMAISTYVGLHWQGGRMRHPGIILGSSWDGHS